MQRMDVAVMNKVDAFLFDYLRWGVPRASEGLRRSLSDFRDYVVEDMNCTATEISHAQDKIIHLQNLLETMDKLKEIG